MQRRRGGSWWEAGVKSELFAAMTGLVQAWSEVYLGNLHCVYIIEANITLPSVSFKNG